MSPTEDTSAGAAGLEVPAHARPRASRSNSASSAQSAAGRSIESVRPSVSARDSQGEAMPSKAGLAAPARPPNTRTSSSTGDVRPTVASPVMPPADYSMPGSNLTEVRVGQTAKPFKIHTDLLNARSPQFKQLLQANGNASSPMLSFPDLDEFAFALFNRWLYGAVLKGPSDFHSMHHYLGLYIIGERFRIERLKNETTDLVRAYYRASNMTAPAYRLEYLYENTQGPNPMRRFLVTTTAYRFLCESDKGLGESMTRVLSKGGQLALDFITALATLHKNELQDVRRGTNCAFHIHEETPRCKARIAEAYE
ncbi:hypothetical protein K490DRAFT_61345 [Saccharata proteae CBS 121410]|uniref:BTB domain-containing protein n=1 Tax=Saccharata proteae CBS 121410 TaxID=1314787 RepID=A0A9P4HZ22_9PEZI|nr:hypothetical protein K490DRAFT_61345 [Saccharata proteae CBS 121410]